MTVTDMQKGRPAGIPNAPQSTLPKGDTSLSENDGYRQALEYLTGLYGETPDGLLWIGGDADGWSGRTFTTPANAARYAVELDARGGKGVYHRSTTLAVRPEKRGEASDSAAVYYFALDADIIGPGHKAANLMPDRAAVDLLIREAGMPEPSHWVSSGGGYYPQWRFPEPIDVRDAEVREHVREAFNRLSGHFIATAEKHGWKLDNVRDLARVFRLPGTANRKVPEAPVVATVSPGAGKPVHLTALARQIPAVKPPEAIAPVAPVDDMDTLLQPATTTVAAHDGTWTRDDAEKEITKRLATLAATQHGDGFNNMLNATALRIGRFVPNFLTEDEARERLITTVTMVFGAPNEQDAATIKSGLTAGLGMPFELVDAAIQPGDAPRSRRVDLTPYLDGSYSPPTPSVGGVRDCGHSLLYPGRWHTLVALNATGKSWFALWHVLDELRKGNTVVYAHFEETSPGGTLGRLMSMAPWLTIEQVVSQFVWLDCSARWESPKEFAACLPEGATLLILDGINAAATQHGDDPSTPAAVQAYRARFVTAATKRDMAVLSLGHPPKARDRQGERHGFGSTAWLDEVDGVGFRMEAAKKTPIRRGEDGYSFVWSVKDRYGQVEALGQLDEERDSGWYKLGAFHVDSREEVAKVRLGSLSVDAKGEALDAIDHLAERVVEYLSKSTGRFESVTQLRDGMRAAKLPVKNLDLGPAIGRLVEQGRVDWPEVPARKSRAGWLVVPESSNDEVLLDV